MTILKNILTTLFRRTQPVRDGTVNAPHVGSTPTAEANRTPWGAYDGGQVTIKAKAKGKVNIKFDPTNTITILTEKKMKGLTEQQIAAIKLDDLRDEISDLAAKSVIKHRNTHRPQRNIKRRCRKLVDQANACIEKTNDKKTFRIKEGKLEEYKKHMADAKELAKTLRSRQTRPFNSTLHFERTVTLRKTTRASLIAYGFLKKKLYSEIEDNPRWKRFERGECGNGEKPDWKQVNAIAFEYSLRTLEIDTLLAKKKLEEEIELWRGN